MSDKFFNINNPTVIVTITQEYPEFVQLSDGNMIKKDTFNNKYQPVLEGFEHEQPKINTFTQTTPIVNPDTFFSTTSLSNNDITKIINVDPTKVPNVSDETRSQVKVVDIDPFNYSKKTTNESLLIPIDPNEQIIPNNTNTNVSQYKVYDNDDDAYDDFVKKTQQNQNNIQKPKPVINVNEKLSEIEILYQDEVLAYGEEEANQRKTKRLKKIQQPVTSIEETNTIENLVQISTQPIIQTEVIKEKIMDPVTMMFSTFKRNHEININVTFTDKIAKPTFIKMMIENMDGDIIGYYKEIIMNNIKKDLITIENAVKRELEIAIFGEEQVDEVVEIPSKEVEPKLLKGKKTAAGKQTYKYINGNGDVVELLPESANKKGFKPYTEIL